MKYVGIVIVLIACNVLLSETIIIKDGESISKAIVSARRGDTLLLQEGVYKENILLKDGVLLQGTSVQGCEIRGDGRKSTVTLNGRSTIQNVTISGGYNGITASNRNSTIKNVRVMLNRGTGIVIYNSLPSIDNCIIVNNGGNGISLSNIKGDIELSNLTIAQNGKNGIFADNDVSLHIKNTLFYSNIFNAVSIKENLPSFENVVIYPKSKPESGVIIVKPIFKKGREFKNMYIQDEKSPAKNVGAKL